MRKSKTLRRSNQIRAQTNRTIVGQQSQSRHKDFIVHAIVVIRDEDHAVIDDGDDEEYRNDVSDAAAAAAAAAAAIDDDCVPDDQVSYEPATGPMILHTSSA